MHSRRSASTPKLSGLNSNWPILRFRVVFRGCRGLNTFGSFQRREIKPFESSFSELPRTHDIKLFFYILGFALAASSPPNLFFRLISALMFRCEQNVCGRVNRAFQIFVASSRLYAYLTALPRSRICPFAKLLSVKINDPLMQHVYIQCLSWSRPNWAPLAFLLSR